MTTLPRADLRGASLQPRTCVICGSTYQPKMSIQATCSKACCEKNKNRKRSDSGVRKVGYDKRERFGRSGSAKIIAAPPEYLDYIGDQYTSFEFEASLHIGLFPPGVTVERGGKRFIICGEPSPLEVALCGIGPYKHQKLVRA